MDQYITHPNRFERVAPVPYLPLRADWCDLPPPVGEEAVQSEIHLKICTQKKVCLKLQEGNGCGFCSEDDFLHGWTVLFELVGISTYYSQGVCHSWIRLSQFVSLRVTPAVPDSCWLHFHDWWDFGQFIFSNLTSQFCKIPPPQCWWKHANLLHFKLSMTSQLLKQFQNENGWFPYKIHGHCQPINRSCVASTFTLGKSFIKASISRQFN